MEYRPEIDGLRALAVLLVLLCHVQLGMSGGFIGVDVFFVISGFLITSIIINETEQKKFNLFRFYGRRFVRLYPALLVVVFITILVSFLLSDPHHLEATFRSGKYVLGSISNIFFSKHLGYFDTAAIQQPFLHTWTLGVEWQFYLLTPVLIWLFLKYSKEALIIFLALLVGVSVVLSQVKLGTNADKAYYLLPYRAFELGIGSLLVFLYPRKCAVVTSVSLTALGFVMIVAAGILYTPQTPFPGYAALLPTVGAALCIYGGQGFVKGNVFRLAPVVYIGKISYSVYLVHWPLLVFWNYVLVFRDIALYDKIAILILSLLLGNVLYLLVERRVTWKKSANQLRSCLVLLCLAVAGIIVSQWVQKHPENLSWRVEGEYTYAKDFASFTHRDHVGSESGEIVALLFGDSMTNNYRGALDDHFKQENKKILIEMGAGCFMLNDRYVENYTRYEGCLPAYNRAQIIWLNNPEIPIILGQEWLSKTHFLDRETGDTFVFQEMSDDYIQFYLKELEGFRKRIGEDRKLIIMAAVLYKRTDDEKRSWTRKSCANRPVILFDACGLSSGVDYPVESTDTYQINLVLKEFAETHKNTYFIDISPVICPNGVCNTRRYDEFYRPNNINHLSVSGSKKLAAYLNEQLGRIM